MQPLLVEVAIEPKSKAEQEKLIAVLTELAAKDPSFRVLTDRESGQTILKGTSEGHLDDKISIFTRASGIDVTIGAPQVAYLERPTRRAEAEYAYKKVLGPKGDFAVVRLAVEPSALGKGTRFKSGVVGGAIPEEYIAGIERGLESVLSAGVVAGFPVVDVDVEVIDGKYHDIDSSQHAFEMATRAALREALQNANSVLLEPIMKVEVVTAVDCVSSIIGDLNVRRGRILSRQPRGDAVVVDAMVPLITLFGYVNNLRAISRQAAFSMQYDHYAPVPMPGDDPAFRPAIGMRA